MSKLSKSSRSTMSTMSLFLAALGVKLLLSESSHGVTGLKLSLMDGHGAESVNNGLTDPEKKLQKMMGARYNQIDPATYAEQAYFMCRPLEDPVNGRCTAGDRYHYFLGETTGEMIENQQEMLTGIEFGESESKSIKQNIVYIDRDGQSSQAEPGKTRDGSSPENAVLLQNIMDLGDILEQAKDKLYGSQENLLGGFQEFFPFWDWLSSNPVRNAYDPSKRSDSGNSDSWLTGLCRLRRKRVEVHEVPTVAAPQNNCMCIEYAPYMRHLWQMSALPIQHSSLSIGNTELDFISQNNVVNSGFVRFRSVRSDKVYQELRPEDSIGSAAFAFEPRLTYLNSRYLGMVPAISGASWRIHSEQGRSRAIQQWLGSLVKHDMTKYGLLFSDCQNFVSNFSAALFLGPGGNPGLKLSGEIDSSCLETQQTKKAAVKKIGKNVFTWGAQFVTNRVTARDKWINLKNWGPVANADLQRIP